MVQKLLQKLVELDKSPKLPERNTLLSSITIQPQQMSLTLKSAATQNMFICC